MQPLLSIIITTHGKNYAIEKYYNLDDYSIFQHYNEPIEIIITEDKINKEPEYIKQLKSKGLDIKWYFSNKAGLEYNRQNGLNVSNGEYITFVDSPDDLVFDYNSLLPILKNNNDVIVVHKHEGDSFYCGFRFNSVMWGKIYKKSLFSITGDFVQFVTAGDFEELFSNVKFTLNLNKKQINLKTEITSKSIIEYKFCQQQNPHISTYLPTQNEIYLFLQKSKNYDDHELFLNYVYGVKECIQNFTNWSHTYPKINYKKDMYNGILKYINQILSEET